MTAADLKIALLTILAAALYINVRARIISVKVRVTIQTALLFVALVAVAIVPSLVFSLCAPSFTFDSKTGLSSRTLLSSGSAASRAIVFTFSNPRNSKINGRIFNLRGALIAKLNTHPALDANAHRVWDGTSNGVAVDAGTYVYRIEAESKIFSGTVEVAGRAIVPAAPAFDFNSASGLSNRFITPNSDGLNDFAVFTFANPRDAEVVGKIFDLRGAQVSEMSVHPSLNGKFNRVWDGKSGGVAVVPGVYIYRIEAEGSAFTGTVTVVR